MNSVENQTDQENRLAERLKRISSGAISVVTLILVVFVGYIMVCSARGKAVEVFGRCILKVVTGSMEPSLHVGDYIYVKKTDAEDLAPGDIISFYSEEQDINGKIVTHRIREINPDGTYITQGDASTISDRKAVRYDQIIGKYQGKARFYRWVGSFGDRKKLLLLFVVIPMTLIAFYEVRTIARLGIEIKREKALDAEEKERLIREAIDKEKERLAREGFKPDETPPDEDIPEEKNDPDEEKCPGEDSREDDVVSGTEGKTDAEEDNSGEEQDHNSEELKLPEKEVDTVESGKTDES